jgi:hypothetical protein
MSRDFDSAIDKISFATSVDRMSPFFQLATSQDISETIAFQSIQGFTTTSPTANNRPPREVTQLVDAIINTQDGAYRSCDLTKRLGSLYAGTMTPPLAPIQGATGQTGNSSQDTYAQRLRRLFRVIGPDIGVEYPFYGSSISSILRRPSGQGGIVNSCPNNPTKTAPGLSVILVNTTQVMPANKNVNAITLFLNSVPPIEMSRAVPFVDVQFFFGREPVDAEQRVQTLSLLKFLEGAVNVGQTGTARLLVDLNTVSGSINGGRSEDSGILSTAGMELFYSPQTLVNANEQSNNSLRATPVIDPFKPFMTFKELSIDIAPSVGLMSYKTAKMEFVFHDRSRLHEIADFVKPDLYGTTELMLEYGWSHPDVPGQGTDTASLLGTNPYGILINGMRCKEKYGIRNVNFNFNESGEVNVTLDLFMKGGNDFYTETIAQHEEGTENILRTIENLARTVSSYERRVFGANRTQTAHTREIRGTQILEASSDWQSRLQLSPDLITNLRDLSRDLSRTANNNPQVQGLINSLNQLYARRTSASPVDDSSGGALAQLSTTTQRSIEHRFALLSGTTDTFLPTNLPEVVGNEARITGRPVPDSPNSANGGSAPATNQAEVNLGGFATKLSLAKLLLIFIGEPLAMTGKYDDVQLIFYPFNQYAGYANTLNVGQFPIDTRFFIQQYVRYRTENLSRAGNMTLRDFLGFVASTLIDDPGATIYGISSLYHEVLNRQTGAVSTVPRYNAVDFQTRLEQRLRDRTPDATFKMPQIDFYVECLPGKDVQDGTPRSNPSRSILRIHIFDRQATQYNTQAGLLAATRDDTLNTIGSLPQQVTDGEEGIADSHRATVTTILNLAENLIEPVNVNSSSGNGSGRAYRIRGGPQEIKSFVMSTMPYILYGIQGTGIIGGANLSSQQDPALSTVNMLRSFRAGPLQANGEQPGGLPLSIIPCELSMLTHGCPLIDFAQQFFVDFNTGTTADNIYAVVAISHRFTQGKFETDLKFAPLDAYGKYSSLVDRLNLAAERLADRPASATTPNNS